MSIITYKNIETANKEIKTTDIRGKEYAEVKERIAAFRKVFPDGYIISQIEKLEDGFVLVDAKVGYYDEAGEPHTIASGKAYEKEGSSNINRTSFIENCETSAVGRALGFAGFGLIGAVATADEITRAQEQLDAQKTEEAQKQKVGPIRAVALRRFLTKNNVSEAVIFSLYKVGDLADLTEKQHANITEHIKDIIAMQKGEG